MEYQLELKQIVDYPRCRIYRPFVRRLMQDINIRTCGGSYLYYYIVLCSYANFRSSYRRLDSITYLVEPGEWICTLPELSRWFRTRFQHQAAAIMDYLQQQHYITYTRLDRGRLINSILITGRPTILLWNTITLARRTPAFSFPHFRRTRTGQYGEMLGDGHRSGYVDPRNLQ